MKSEPVLTAASIAGVIMAGLAMAVSLGWLSLTDAQMQTVQAFILPALGLLLPLAAAWWARSKVTPTAAPKTQTGEPGVIVPVATAQAMGMLPDGD